MSRYRTLLMQRLTVAILLFTALFSQVQVLYACASMTGKPSHVCCCGKHTGHDCAMQDTCTMLDHDREEGCCQLDYDLLTDHVMSNAASTVDMLTLLLDSPQPPHFQNPLRCRTSAGGGFPRFTCSPHISCLPTAADRPISSPGACACNHLSR